MARSDELLIEKLRDLENYYTQPLYLLIHEAADRIEALTRSNDEPTEAIQTIAQVLWEKVGPAITAARAADIARDVYAAINAMRSAS